MKSLDVISTVFEEELKQKTLMKSFALSYINFLKHFEIGGKGFVVDNISMKVCAVFEKALALESPLSEEDKNDLIFAYYDYMLENATTIQQLLAV